MLPCAGAVSGPSPSGSPWQTKQASDPGVHLVVLRLRFRGEIRKVEVLRRRDRAIGPDRKADVRIVVHVPGGIDGSIRLRRRAVIERSIRIQAHSHDGGQMSAVVDPVERARAIGR